MTGPSPRSLPAVAGSVMADAGVGTIALVALAILGATYAGWGSVASRPTLGSAAGIGLALVVAGFLLSMRGPGVRRGGPGDTADAMQGARGWLETAALALVATAFVAALAFDLRPRRTWALAAGSLLAAWAVLIGTAIRRASAARPASDEAAHSIVEAAAVAHALGAVLVEAVVRPSAGATWVAAAGLGFLPAVWLASVATVRPASGPGSGIRDHALQGATFVAGIVVPAVWLAAGLADRLAGATAVAAGLAGAVAMRWSGPGRGVPPA